MPADWRELVGGLRSSPALILLVEQRRASAGRVEGSLEHALHGLLVAPIDVTGEGTS